MNQVLALILFPVLAGFIIWFVWYVKSETEKNEVEMEEQRGRVLELFYRNRYLRYQHPLNQARETIIPVRTTPVRKRKSSESTIVVHQTQLCPVERQSKSVRESKGWIKSGNGWTGYYRTPYGSYRGRIEERYSGHWQFYITAPPQCLKQHSHSGCFFPRGGNTYEVHFNLMPKNVDDGISHIERTLIEAHEGRHSRQSA